MRTLRIMVIGTMLGMGAVSVSPVVAADAPTPGQCRQEIGQLCANVEHGPALEECVTKNFDHLSPECQERVRARRAKRQQHQAAPATGTPQ
jgi:hypothetical protein